MKENGVVCVDSKYKPSTDWMHDFVKKGMDIIAIDDPNRV